MKIPSHLPHDLLWGLALGGTAVLTIQVLTWLGLGLSNLTWILPWAWVVVFAVLAGRSLGQRLGRRPRFLQALLLLVVMLLVSRILYQTYMFVYINFVDPTWVDTVAEVWSGQLAEAGSTAAEVDTKIANFHQQWETRYVFTWGLVGYVLPELFLGGLAMLVGVVQPWKKDSPGQR